MRVSRAWLVVPVATVVAMVAASGACSGTSGGAFTLPMGASGVTPFGTCTTSGTYAQVSAVDCQGSNIMCSTYYALCNGTDFVGCTCTIPSGYNPSSGFTISDGGAQESSVTPSDGGGGGTDAGSADSGTDAGSSDGGSSTTEGGSATDAATTG